MLLRCDKFWVGKCLPKVPFGKGALEGKGPALAVCEMRPDEGIGPYGVLAALAPSDEGCLDGRPQAAPTEFHTPVGAGVLTGPCMACRGRHALQKTRYVPYTRGPQGAAPLPFVIYSIFSPWLPLTRELGRADDIRPYVVLARRLPLWGSPSVRCPHHVGPALPPNCPRRGRGGCAPTHLKRAGGRVFNYQSIFFRYCPV